LRPVIVHYHIFKNAGCSVDRILEGSFGDSWRTLEGATATSLLRPGDLSLFLRDRPGVRAVSSHLLRPPAPADLDVLPIVLIRHPLDRAFSVYSQLHRNTSGTFLSETVAWRSGFAEFVRWCLEHRSLGGMVIADYQVIHLSPASFRAKHIHEAVATADDLRRAIDYLSDGPCFGTVERIDAVMARLRLAAEKVDLPLSITSVAENVTLGRPRDLAERVSIAQRQLGPDLYERYRQANRHDYRLYEWARDYHTDDVWLSGPSVHASARVA
jgi:hypothetical protein